MQSPETPNDFPRSRPETYIQYKQEKGSDIKSGDLAHYFNSEVFTLGNQTALLEIAIERLALDPAQKAELLQRINTIEQSLTVASVIANDTFQALQNKE